MAIVQALKSVGDPGAIPPLTEVLRRSPDAGLRMAAANALGSLPGEESVEALDAALADPELWVRRNAALSLSAHRRGERAVPHLLEMLDPSNLSFLRDPDGELRRQALKSAIEALAGLGELSAVPLLEGLAKSDPDPRVQNAALKALEELRQSRRPR
jgi:HEAT repeat protein